MLHYFIQKKSTTEAHRILVETYGDWFRRFKNNAFDVEEKEYSGIPKKFKYQKLNALLYEDLCQAQAELAESLGVDHTTLSKHLKALGNIQKQGHCVPYELKPREVKRCLVTCEPLLRRSKRKGFLHCIVL